jgi:mannosyltransferase OCH1-like enzyme
MIPKIIHQMGPTSIINWHPIWEECQNSWKKNFKNFEYVFWNDENIRNLIKTNYPEILKYYDEFPYHIIRIDLSRFCILHSYGGIYADLDIYCYKNFYNNLTNDLYIVESWKEWGEKVQNSLMISNKNNNFWIKCIRNCIEKYTFKKVDDYSNESEYILNISGPKLISKIINDKVDILPKEIFNPKIKNQFNWAGQDYSSEAHFKALMDFDKLNIMNDNIVTRHYLTGKWEMSNGDQ